MHDLSQAGSGGHGFSLYGFGTQGLGQGSKLESISQQHPVSAIHAKASRDM